MRYTIRALRRDAGVSLFVILIAALGIGASSTVFSVVNALLLRPLPFGDPGALVWIANRDTGGLSGQTTQVGHMLDAARPVGRRPARGLPPRAAGLTHRSDVGPQGGMRPSARRVSRR